MYKKIYLNGKHKDKYVKVSPEDYAHLSQYNWCLHPRGYAHGWYPVNGTRKKVLMHRVILGILEDHSVVADHKNHDMLDNRRENLRPVTQFENTHNRKDSYRIAFDPEVEGWVCRIGVRTVQYALGPYETDDLAKAAGVKFKSQHVKVLNTKRETLDPPIIHLSDYKRARNKEIQDLRRKESEQERNLRRNQRQEAAEAAQKEKELEKQRIKREKEEQLSLYRENSLKNVEGVRWSLSRHGWHSYLDTDYEIQDGKINKVDAVTRVSIGYFETFEEAFEAREDFKRERRKLRAKKTRKCQNCKEDQPRDYYTLTAHGNLSYTCKDCKSRTRKTWAKTTKSCSTCKVVRDLVDYPKTKKGNPSSICVECTELKLKEKERKAEAYRAIWGIEKP